MRRPTGDGLAGAPPRLLAETSPTLGSERPPRRRADLIRGGRPAAYLLYEVGGRKVSLFIATLLPGIRLGAREEHIKGVELYASVINGVTVAWWEDEDAGRVYAAVSTDRAGRVLDFVLLCAKSERVSWLRPSRSVWHRTSGGLG